MEIVSPKFPGMKGLGKSFTLFEEWYALQQVRQGLARHPGAGDQGHDRRALPAPAVSGHVGPDATARAASSIPRWATTKSGRNKTFRQVLMGGIAWAVGDADADVTPNIAEVTPDANKTKN